MTCYMEKAAQAIIYIYIYSLQAQQHPGPNETINPAEDKCKNPCGANDTIPNFTMKNGLIVGISFLLG